MARESIFNKLWVIESLPVGDLKTGTLLVDNQLNDVKQDNPDLLIQLEKPITKAELAEVLHKIRDEAREGIYPMLHLECHGCPDGLGVASGELVEWDELREVLIEINQACRLNLVIVLAACNGAHLIKVSKKLDRAPFWAIIGPEQEVIAGDIEKDFDGFYQSFFKSLSGDAAMDALNNGKSPSERTYHFLSAEGLFAKAYRKYYRSHCIGRGRRERIEYLTTQAMNHPDVNRRGVAWARNKVKKELAFEDTHFEMIRDRFFFMDCYPENKQRFPLQFDEVIGNV